MRKVLFFLILLSTGSGFSQIVEQPITDFSQEGDVDGVLVDVRTPDEYQQGHLADAVNIDFFNADFANNLDTIDRQKKVYLYCKKGGRSAKAAKMLDSLGFKHIVDLTGGYDAYMESKREGQK